MKQSVANTDEVAQMQNQLRSLTADKQMLTTRVSDADKAVEEGKHEIARYALLYNFVYCKHL